VDLKRRFARGCAAALLITSTLAVSAAAQSRDTDLRSNAVEAAQIGIENFGRVNPTYYRGAQPKGRDYADLASLGVKTVINLTSDDADAGERDMALHAGMRYVQIPMTTRRPPSSAQLAEFMGIVTDPSNQPVYVHCVGGRHRTGVMTAAYRMTYDGWSADQAFKEMKRYRFGADFLHPEFKKFVYAYPARLAEAAPAPVAPTKTGG
jgi:protein tyrosine/serine phosphatase